MELPAVDGKPSRSSELNPAAPAKATESVNRPVDAGRPPAAGPPESIREREKQRWVDRLAKLENPPSSRDELKARLNHLEPGHPSSPWEEDGTPKPPVPRLSDAERPLSPLSDADYKSHVSEVANKLERARAEGLQTEKLYALSPDHQEWSADRAKIHRSIINEAWDQAADVPGERRAIIAGGLGGAGKTTVLADQAGVDRSQYLTIDPDKFKEALAKRGLVPDVPGLAPMEASSLAHEESSYLSRQLAMRATAEGKNVIWDITMSSAESASRRVNDLRRAGYDHIEGIFVDIPIETSIERTEARHRRGCDSYLAGEDIGGRYVPAEVIRAQKDAEFGSVNRKAFEELKSQFNAWAIYDNSVDGRPAVLLDASTTLPSPVQRRADEMDA
jgi:predicted ABC-type ATPase